MGFQRRPTVTVTDQKTGISAMAEIFRKGGEKEALRIANKLLRAKVWAANKLVKEIEILKSEVGDL